MKSIYLFVIAVLTSLTGCGKWIPAKYATMAEAFASFDARSLENQAPPGSYREQLFKHPVSIVVAAAKSSLGVNNLQIDEMSVSQNILFVRSERFLEPPPNLLNCPNNHFTNVRKQVWQDYLAIVFNTLGPETTSVRVYARTQGRCYKTDSCYGIDPCPDYARVHWALGYDSADGIIKRYLETIASQIEKGTEYPKQ